MPNCARCHGHVSADYARVFATDGRIDGCPQCSTNREGTTSFAQTDDARETSAADAPGIPVPSSDKQDVEIVTDGGGDR